MFIDNFVWDKWDLKALDIKGYTDYSQQIELQVA